MFEMDASLSNALRCLLAAHTTCGVTFGGVVSTEEARDDMVDFMKEFFFIFLILSSEMVPPAEVTENQEDGCWEANKQSKVTHCELRSPNDVCLCLAHTLSAVARCGTCFCLSVQIVYDD